MLFIYVDSMTRSSIFVCALVHISFSGPNEVIESLACPFRTSYVVKGPTLQEMILLVQYSIGIYWEVNKYLSLSMVIWDNQPTVINVEDYCNS